MSDSNGLKAAVVEEMMDQVDGTEVLESGTVQGQIDAQEAGRSLGRRVGKQVGRELGESIGRDVHLALRDELEAGSDRDRLLSVAKSSVREGLTRGIQSVSGAEPTAGTAPSSETEPDDSGDGPSIEDVDDLRRDTLEEFLRMLSYDDLQSIAKDVDVKANLSQQEMIDRIVETVTDADGPSNGEGADGSSSGDEADEPTAEASES